MLERPRLPTIFQAIRETLSTLVESHTIPYSVHQGCNEHLLSLFEMVRVQRNDAVHPAAAVVNQTKVFLSLQTFPTALECIHGLADWARDNPATRGD